MAGMSHRTRMTEPPATLPASTYGHMPPKTKLPRTVSEKTAIASQRHSMTSNSSIGQRSSTSLDGLPGLAGSRPSGIPRPTKTSSNIRLDTLAPSRPTVASAYRPRAASNITGIGTRTTMRNRSMERIAPSNNTPRIITDDDLLSLEPTLPSLEMDQNIMFEMAVPQKQLPQSTTLPPRLIPELQALAATSQRRPTPAMSTHSTISSPSTQFTTSPSPWSASTTTTTPTSWSSASPSLVQPTSSMLVGSKRSQTVPIPTAARTAMPKLPVLQESGVSSASSSKVNVQAQETSEPKKLRKKTPLSSPAPTPPPRKSSVKRNRSRSNSKNEDQGSSTSVAPLVPREQDISPVMRHVQESITRQTQTLQGNSLTDRHIKLQDALNTIPVRPSRDGMDDLDVRRPQRVNTNHPKYDEQARKLLDAAQIEALPQPTSKPETPVTPPPEELRPTTPSQAPRSRLAKISRLAIFGKSPKIPPTESEQPAQPRKLQRRGPSAGTGHEGYGRFGRSKDRKTSLDGNNTGTDSESSVASTRRKPMRSLSRRGRSSSRQPDPSDQSDLDEFAASRLKPVVIVGGSQKQSGALDSNPFQKHKQGSREEGNETTLVDSSNTQDEARHASVASTGPLMRESRLIFHLDSLDLHDKPSSSSFHPQKFDNIDHARLPPTINETSSLNQPYVSGFNTSQSSFASTSIAMTDTANELYKVDFRSAETSQKKSRKLNWGFFKKKEFAPESYQPRTTSRLEAPRMTVRVSALPPARPMPYYAMLESENESSNVETIGEFLAEAVSPMLMEENGEEMESPVSPLDESEIEPEHPERLMSILPPIALPSKHVEKLSHDFIATQESAKNHSKTSLPSEPVTMPRQPRLAQVGRIPKVVPTTQAIAPSQASFSRPFQHDATVHHQDTLKLSKKPIVPPTLSIRTDVTAKRPSKSTDIEKPASAPARAGTEPTPLANREPARDFLKFPDRGSTTSSSSDGVQSVMGPPLLPAPEFPTRSIRYTTTEDDVWNEYDDFIDRVISTPRLKKSKARITEEDRIPLPLVRQNDALTGISSLRRTGPKGLAVDTSLAPPPLLFASPMSVGSNETDHEFHLRRSRIISALHSSMDPSSPFSIGDYLAELGEVKRNSGRTSGRLSDSSLSQTTLRSPRMLYAFPEPPVTQPENRHYENVAQIDELERSKDPVRHSERSYASLMVSRWLSFGRVLFSPAHEDLQKQPERHVLVIDGLGNEDWSIYCAVTYQSEQAYVYDLKETGHTRSTTLPTEAGQVPPKFRRRELTSFYDAFKFPDNFFSVIVLRFPPVMAESKLKHIISECRRVLAPGGYMELMLLDLDIVNMGVVTRRAMRELKTQIAMRDREVSLKPVIDNVQSVLGEKGFSKLSKFIVGVPVVGQPPGVDSPASSRSSGASDQSRKGLLAGPRPFGTMPTKMKQQQHQQQHNFSLNDLVADHSDNADAKIGRVVSRTARSWWQHCFEAAVISDGNLSNSIFADKQVLHECKSRASSFKLLIAYSQKPVASAIGTRRRTMSEPVIATLAHAERP